MTDPIRAKLIELVPEIMELEFGCRFVLGDSIIRIVDYPGYGDFACSEHSDYNDLFLPNVENIGRPITLADILRAVEKGCKVGMSIDTIGDFYDEDQMDMGVRWNMALDYDNQPQPTKDFIGKLLDVTE